MKVAIYARVSSEAQEARGTIGSQLEVLRARVAERATNWWRSSATTATPGRA